MTLKRIISTILALTMVMSVLLSSVSCDALINELLADSSSNGSQTYIEDETEIEETTKKKKNTTEEDESEPQEESETEEESLDETSKVENPTINEPITKPGVITEKPIEKPTEAPTETPTETPTTEADNEWESNTWYIYAQEEIDSGYVDCPINDSDLGYTYFSESYHVAGNMDSVKIVDGVAVYQMAGFAAYWNESEGKYAYTVDFYSATNGASAAFVRGAKDGFTGWDPDYFGAAGTGQIYTSGIAHGKAGIYFNVRGTKLFLTIKAWDDANFEEPKVFEIIIPGCVGTTTAVDLGDVIYFKSGEKTVAKIDLLGSANYGEIQDNMVEHAIVTTWDGQVVQIDKALITADIVGSDYGLSNRTGEAQITYIEYSSAKHVEVNDNLDKISLVVTSESRYVEGNVIDVRAVGEGHLTVALYNGKTLVMSYVKGSAEGFVPGGADGITIADQSLASIPAGEYTIKLLDDSLNVLYECAVTVVSVGSPILTLDADVLAKTSDLNNSWYYCGVDINISADGDYVTVTTREDEWGMSDYNWYVHYGDPIKASAFMVMKYRSEAVNKGSTNELFFATTYTGDVSSYYHVDFSDAMIHDGKWHTVVVDISHFDVPDMDKLTILRIDLLNDVKGNKNIDVEWINFFATLEDAENYSAVSIDLYDVEEITGHFTSRINASSDPWSVCYIAAGETDERGLPMLYEGCFKLGSYDLSEYSKVRITYCMDQSEVTWNNYNASNKNAMAILSESVPANFHTNGQDISDIIIAEGEYAFHMDKSWQWLTMEIDISDVDYNGDIYVTVDEFLPGTTVIFKNVTLVP